MKEIRASKLPLMLALGFLAACTSAPKPYETAPGSGARGEGDAVSHGPALARPLTRDGDNLRPVFSPDGKRLLFISEKREAHSNAQLYEIDLASGAEKRITYHDGDVAGAAYLPDGQRVLYASGTDEIKEDPYFIRNLLKKYDSTAKSATATETRDDSNETRSAALPSSGGRYRGTLEASDPGPFELYLSKLDGSEIRHLTKSPGLDAWPTLSGDGRQLVFSSERGGRRDLYAQPVGDGNARRLTADPLREIDPALSIDGKRLAWSTLAEDGKTAMIYVSEGRFATATRQTAKQAMNVSPAWRPGTDELVFSSDRADGTEFDLYSLDRKTGCLKRLTATPNDELFPTFSPDGKQIAFTSNHSGRQQIYIMDYRPPTECLSETP